MIISFVKDYFRKNAKEPRLRYTVYMFSNYFLGFPILSSQIFYQCFWLNKIILPCTA